MINAGILGYKLQRWFPVDVEINLLFRDKPIKLGKARDIQEKPYDMQILALYHLS